MSVVWLQPAALWSLAVLALPLLIHLLVRQRSRQMRFPSLRFLEATRLAAIRRQAISDWPLLVVRLLVLASAATASAVPVFVSDDRRETWNERVLRAIVTTTPTAGRAAPALAATVERERQSSINSTVLEAGPDIAGALRDATSWLASGPPAAREIVVIGTPRQGSVSDAEIRSLPPKLGVRFVVVPLETPGSFDGIAIAAAGSGQPMRFSVRVTPEPERTLVSYRVGGTDVPSDVIDIRAAAGEERQADAIRRAVLAEGVMLNRRAERALTLAFGGATLSSSSAETRPPRLLWMREMLARLPGLTGGEQDDRLIVHAPIRATDAQAPALASRVVAAVFGQDVRGIETQPIPAATLESWTRLPRPDDSVQPSDEGDRRWLWGLALTLLVLEGWIRRPRAAAASQPMTDMHADQEARVA